MDNMTKYDFKDDLLLNPFQYFQPSGTGQILQSWVDLYKNYIEFDPRPFVNIKL